MKRNYVTQEIFDLEVKRLDRQDVSTDERMKERISLQIDRISTQISCHERVTAGQYQETWRQIETLAREQSRMSGDIRELRGEVSGLKDNIESLKHFMTWGLALIGLLTVIAPVIAGMIK